MTQDSLQFGPDLDMLIAGVLSGDGPWPLPPEASAVLRMLAQHRSILRPLPLRELVAHTGLSEREVKECVRSLVVDFGVPVGALRGDPSGYYVAESAEERALAVRPLIHEIRNLALRVRALVGTHEFTELLGQMRFDNTGGRR